MNALYKKITLATLLLAGVYGLTLFAESIPNPDPQNPPLTAEEKRERRRNQVVKEWNTDAKGKRRWLDHLTVWDESGLKLEEIEYAVYGQRERVTFEYDAYGKCIRENVYNDKNKLYRIRKYEYNEEGRKKIQFNYNPDGKLFSTKVFEYSYKDAESSE